MPGSGRVRALIRTKLSSVCTEITYVFWNKLKRRVCLRRSDHPPWTVDGPTAGSGDR
jgi:hypothetical protein